MVPKLYKRIALYCHSVYKMFHEFCWYLPHQRGNFCWGFFGGVIFLFVFFFFPSLRKGQCVVYTGEYKAKSSLSNGRLPTPGAPGELALDEQKSTCCFVSDPPHSAASGCGGFSVLCGRSVISRGVVQRNAGIKSQALLFWRSVETLPCPLHLLRRPPHRHPDNLPVLLGLPL